MKERPILFSAPMVRAILEGRKTQTRRPVTHPVLEDLSEIVDQCGGWWGDHERRFEARCPYGQPGDRLWVRETWGVGSRPDPWGGYDGIEYRADEAWLEDGDDLPCHKVQEPDHVCLGDYRSGWKPGIHMPRWASRILLDVTAVRVERLQDISEADVQAEGIQEIVDAGVDHDGTPRDAYRALWESINGAGSWAANPWVWVIEFREAA